MDNVPTGAGTGGFPALPEDYPPKRPRDYHLEPGQVGKDV